MSAPALDFFTLSFVFKNIPGSFAHFHSADLQAGTQEGPLTPADLKVSATR
jgi:hypothetical protein